MGARVGEGCGARGGWEVGGAGTSDKRVEEETGKEEKN